MPIDFPAMKADSVGFPCGQCPRLEDEDVDMVQSGAIVRHLARKHDMYGDNLKEQAMVDMIIESVETLRSKYGALIFEDKLSEEGKKAYFADRVDVAGTEKRNGGAHWAYLDRLMKKHQGVGPYVLGAKLSVADIVLYEAVAINIGIFEDEFRSAWPALAAHHDAVAALPSVAEYLASDRRHPQTFS